MSDIEKVGSVKPKAEPKRWEHCEEFMSLLPFLWPKEEPRLKVLFALASRLVLLMLAGVQLRGDLQDAALRKLRSPALRCRRVCLPPSCAD